MTELPILKIASPCSVKWEQMSGDERVRRCAECDHEVYDFSAMDADAIARLLAERSGLRTCARLFQRSDGKILTKDCQQERKAKVRYVSRVAGAALGVAMSVTLPSAAQAQQAPSSTQAREHSTGIAVTLHDSTGLKVTGVHIVVTSKAGVKAGEGTSDENGTFSIGGLKPGHYLLSIHVREGMMAPPVRVLVKKGKITEFDQDMFGPFIGEVSLKSGREVKPKG
jgi:hypothetical protein